MFKTPTVFILGAGASWHYGYPTGEELVKMVIKSAQENADFFNRLAEVDPSGVPAEKLPRFVTEKYKDRGAENLMLREAANDAELLANQAQQFNPLVIDYFLGYNHKLQSIGALCIAQAILSCEKASKLGNDNRRKLMLNSTSRIEQESGSEIDITKFKDDWYRFILHRLAIGCKRSCDLLENKISFITFNYDVSLEQKLYDGLCAIDMFRREHVNSLLNSDRIIHMYGCVRSKTSFHQDNGQNLFSLPLMRNTN